MYSSPSSLSERPRHSGQLPAFGRFLEADPLGYEDSPNLYAYVLNDPVNLSDPLGLNSECAIQPGTRICGFVTDDGRPASAMAGVSHAFPPGTFGGAGQGGHWVNVGGSSTGGAQLPDGGFDVVVTAVRVWQPWFSGGWASISASSPLRRTSKSAVNGQQRRRREPFDAKADYCGSRGTEGIPDGMFSKACYIHDNCYSTPGRSKFACDIALVVNIPIYSKRGIALSPFIGIAYGIGLLIEGEISGKSLKAYRDAQGRAQ